MRIRPAMVAASAIALQLAQSVYGATESWTADSGEWATASNWNSGAGPVPGAGDSVLINDDDNTSRDVTYNYTGGKITLASLTVDNDGAAGINTLSMTGSGTSLAADDEYFGDSGTTTMLGYGVIVQSVGTNTVSDTLTLGMDVDDRGTYSLSSGATLVSSGDEQIGYNGTGIIDQTGGTNSAEGGLLLGDKTGSVGSYSLSGGMLKSSEDEYVGESGDGTFDQSGGTNSVTLMLWDGYGAAAGGDYILGAGTLSVEPAESMGQDANPAYFDQTGGLNTTSEFLYIECGTYTMTGGSLAVTDYLFLGNFTNAVFSLGGTGTVSIGTNLQIGFHDVNGSFSQSGSSSLTVSGDLDVGYSLSTSAEYDLSGGSLTAGVEFVGDSSNGNFIQTGGSNTASAIEVGNSGSGTYSMTGGSVLAFALAVGDGAVGEFTLGGTASLEVDGDAYVGYTSIGNFTQTATSTDTVTGDLDLGYSSDTTGEYLLQAGTLDVDENLYVGGGNTGSGGAGELENQGGTMTISGTLRVYADGSEVSISGGVTTAARTINDALISESAGTAGLGSVSGTGSIFVGSSSGSPAEMTVTALVQDNVTVEPTGTFTLVGGSATNTLNELTVSGAGVFDITNGHLYIDYGSSSDPVSTIAGYIKSGYNGGSWNGPGIISSTAQTPTDGFKYGVGWADGADGIVSGITSGEIEIKYTLLGDANLDGTVNGSDFSILASNFGKGFTNWDQGNFLYTSSINGSDFSALAANFGQGDSGADASVSAADVAALDAFAAANDLPMPTFASVPEPAGGVTLFCVAAGALKRRRRGN